jgi:hypothetical protein
MVPSIGQGLVDHNDVARELSSHAEPAAAPLRAGLAALARPGGYHETARARPVTA